jgi:hypothetical protein
MVFEGQVPIRSKIVMDNTKSEEVNASTHMWDIKFLRGKRCNLKVSKFLQILGILNNVLKQDLFQRQS